MSWLWRWGAPLLAGGGALAAAGLGALWLSGSDAAGRAGEVAISGVAFSAALFLCWIVGRRPGVGGQPGLPSDKAAHPTDAMVATVVVFAFMVLAATMLDAPITWDEHRALIRYALMPLGEIARTYDDPNNHVLHTLAVRLAHQGGGYSLPVLRLPAFASFCLLLPAVWWFARNEFGPTAAAFATAFVGMSPLLVQYATHARGYTLLLLCFMATLLCGRALVRRPDRNGLWAAWAAAVALGFYTIPVMAYPALTAATWMLLVRWRQGGARQCGLFAVKMAAWSVVAAAGAALLYAPILATEGVWGVHDTLAKQIRGPYVLSASPALLWHPFELWNAWHFKFPAPAKGVLFALVIVGAAVPGWRSRPSAGTLLLAVGLANCILLATRPFMPAPRMTLYMLPLVMTAAGVGAAFVLEQATALVAGAHRPRVAAGPGRRTAAQGATALVAGVLAFWSAQPGVYMPSPPQGWRLRALVSSATPSMESGDYCATFNYWARMAVVQMREHFQVDYNAGYWFPFGQPESRWSVHQAFRAGNDSEPETASESRMKARAGDEADGRLFVFYPRKPDDTLPTFAEEFVEAHPPDHELVAALDGGMVYVLNDWVKHPWRSR